ncbi:fatty acid biosynthesis [Rhodopirellula islandica]|uniref:Fatty acid biosynthesis n=1 Tax=Rhodopirellula islandica TaxID=595434 RepID=A0A0J1BCK8_RHOIS|nr:acetyl-CoA carboxylase [Rhodopirellula islandica]KLU04370.1 fatty acid biosynthesis [Rhodopirellula islandica]
MSKSRRILLTEGSSTSARQTLHCLGGRHTIDVMDSAALSQGRFSTFVRHWHRCPLSSVDPIAYLRRLKELIDAHGYDVVIATHEQAYLLSRVRDQLQNHVGVALPTFEAIDRLQNKANFARVMKEQGLPQPKTRIIDGTSLETLREGCLAQSDFPCFLKTAHGTAGRGVIAIHDPTEMLEWVNEQTANSDSLPNQEIVLQSAAPGELSILQAIFDRGRLVAWHDAMSLRRGVGGAPIVRVSTHRENVADDVRQLGQSLDWHGALFVEYFYDEASRRHQFIEANPRIGETVNAMLAGVNLCEILVNVSLQEIPPSSPVATGVAGVKSHQFLTALLDQAMQTNSRAAVWHECVNRLRHRQGYRDSQPEMMRLRQDPLSGIPPLAIAFELLLSPQRSHKMVRSTVANYGLNADAVANIASLPDQELLAIFG